MRSNVDTINLEFNLFTKITAGGICETPERGLTSVLGAVPCDGVDRQVGPDVPRTDHAHTDPAVFELGTKTVEVGLGGVFRCCV